jgi:hypothetical protein
MTNQLQKAYLEIETGSRIDCMFNPAKLSFSLSNDWSSDKLPGQNTPSLRFGGGKSGTFDLNLIFDTTSDGKAVTIYTKKILELMKVDPNLGNTNSAMTNGRPPWVKFHWGTHLHSFRAVLTSVNVAYTYFSNEGLPLRASVDVQLSQFEPDANWGAQNPTSGTPQPGRTHQLQVGDTLDRLAARYYADSTKWRDIALANDIADPLDLKPGRVLTIPKDDE